MAQETSNAHQTETDHVFAHAADYAERGIRTGRTLQSELLRAMVRALIRRIATNIRGGSTELPRTGGSTAARKT